MAQELLQEQAGPTGRSGSGSRRRSAARAGCPDGLTLELRSMLQECRDLREVQVRAAAGADCASCATEPCAAVSAAAAVAGAQRHAPLGEQHARGCPAVLAKGVPPLVRCQVVVAEVGGDMGGPLLCTTLSRLPKLKKARAAALLVWSDARTGRDAKGGSHRSVPAQRAAMPALPRRTRLRRRGRRRWRGGWAPSCLGTWRYGGWEPHTSAAAQSFHQGLR